MNGIAVGALAFNAAVETARVGEQGEGFAVVAGAKRVQEGGSPMNEIDDSFQEVAALVMDIAATSREQSYGCEQVSQAMAHIDEVNQQDAALVKEAATAAKGLEYQTGSLANAISMFKPGEENAAGRQRRTRRSAPRLDVVKQSRSSPRRTKISHPAPTRRTPRLPRPHHRGSNDGWKEF